MKYLFYKCNYDMLLLSPKDITTPPHAHEGVELTLVLNGNANTYINGVEYVLNKGDILMSFPNVIHSHDYCSSDFSSVIILFPVKTLPQLKKVFLTKIPKFPIIRNAHKKIIDLILTLNTNQGEFKKEFDYGIMLTVLSMLLNDIELLNRQVHDDRVNEIFNFCDENYNKNLTIEMVAKHLLVSKAYVSYIFTKIIKINFRTYINSIRLSKAIKMLKETNLTITEIAFESGFESLRTFNRVFQKEMKISPLKYKKQRFWLLKTNK